MLSNLFHATGVCQKTVEYAFQYAKGMRCGDLDAGKTIQTTDNALSAKRLGDKIKVNEQWSSTCENVMTEVIKNKCVLVEQFQGK